jgi:hypothetical protein
MSANPTDSVTTVVIEMEPGWVYVKMADPKPAPDRIEFFLRRTIDEWFDARPAFVIDRAEAITNHGEMLGIHVWYHVAEDRHQPTSPPKPLPDSFTIEVHGQIAQQHSKEYVEAVLDDAMRILPSYQHRNDTLVVINPRRLAVILDKQARRGAVIAVDLIEQVVDGPMKMKLQAWLASPASPFYVMHLAGSWFSAH